MEFNGGLFADTEALPVDNVQLSLLIEAAQAGLLGDKRAETDALLSERREVLP